MSIIQAIILGIIQGLTEFIPISSSGHLVIAHQLLDAPDSLAFDVALHGGTLLALLVYFHKDIVRLTRAFFVPSAETNLARLLAAATVPAVIAGILLESKAESMLRSTTIIALSLILAGCIMLVAEWYMQKRHTQTKKLETMTLKQALIVGGAQALALIPGVSRSGSTITAGLFAGLDRVAATRFAFLLGVPIITGAFIKTMMSGGTGEFQSQPAVFIAGATAAFLSGLLATRFLIRYLSKHSLAVFAWYRIALGILVLLVL